MKLITAPSAGCALNAALRGHQCGSMSLAPAHGANGVFHQVVAPP